jgi:uncharacterized protein (TIGR03086 family)
MADVDLLDTVLDKTGGLVAGVRPDQRSLPTPCPEYDVAALLDHLVEWMQRFATGAEGSAGGDGAGGSEAGPEPEVDAPPAAQFSEAADRAVAAFRGGATERPVKVAQAELPGRAVVGLMLMEYIGHGWDLAKATGQPVPYADDEAAAALAAGTGMLTDDYRGPDKAFGRVVPVPAEASAVDRLVGFLGREP